ncbi:hypothetical protein D3C71_1341450 [compost metagenome]|jgi:hypothetical protein
MLQNVLDGSFALSAQGRMTEDGTSWFGVGLEHPDVFILINAEIKANFTEQMTMLDF